LTAECFHSILYDAISLQLGDQLVVGGGGFFTPFGHGRQIVDVFEKLLEFFDGENNGGLFARLVGDVLDV
jgi:hypothetical protein